MTSRTLPSGHAGFAVSFASDLWSRLSGRRPTPFRPGDQLICGGETWTVSAVITERGGGRQWPTVGLTRGAATVWITVDGDDVTRFEPLPDVRMDAEDRLTWKGRTYTVTARGTYTVTDVAGTTEAAVGDRASFLTLTNPEESEHWISVERWEGGATEVSLACPWRIDQVVQPGRSS